MKKTLFIFTLILVPACIAQTGVYSGPSILSSPGSVLGRAAGQSISYRVYAAVGAFYSTEVTPNDVDEGGNLIGYDTYGATANFGAYGVKQRARDMFSLDYNSSFFINRNSTYRSNHLRYGNHRFSFNYGRQLSARTQFSVRQGFGSYGYGAGSYYVPLVSDPTLDVGDPGDEAFDSRTTVFSTSAGLSHMLSRRWQASFGGGGFVVNRSSNLITSRGGSANGSIAYMLGPDKQIGGGYQFSRYNYARNVGDMWAHTLFLSYSQQLNPEWSFTVAAGGLRAETERLQQVSIDPVIAAITGQQNVVEAFYASYNGAMVRASINRAFRRSGLSFNYHRGISPGTAFMTASRHESAGVNYSYTATDKLNLNVGARYGRYKNLSQGTGQWNSGGVRFGTSYRLGRGMHLTASVNLMRHDYSTGTLERNRLAVHAGIAFSPGERPLTIF